jgi:serine O-acetyltransferase
MNNILSYIKLCLNSTFIDYPKKALSIIDEVLNISMKETLIDVNIKYEAKLIKFEIVDLLDLFQKEPTIEAVFFYRLERNIYLKDKQNIILPYLASVMRRRTGCEIYYSTEIGRGFNIQHGFGIVIGPRYKIGKNFTIHQGVTLGQKNLNSPNEQIVIGDNVTIFSNATILGNINIGQNSKVAANAVLINSIGDNEVYGGIPAKKIK